MYPCSLAKYPTVASPAGAAVVAVLPLLERTVDVCWGGAASPRSMPHGPPACLHAMLHTRTLVVEEHGQLPSHRCRTSASSASAPVDGRTVGGARSPQPGRACKPCRPFRGIRGVWWHGEQCNSTGGTKSRSGARSEVRCCVAPPREAHPAQIARAHFHRHPIPSACGWTLPAARPHSCRCRRSGICTKLRAPPVPVPSPPTCTQPQPQSQLRVAPRASACAAAGRPRSRRRHAARNQLQRTAAWLPPPRARTRPRHPHAPKPSPAASMASWLPTHHLPPLLRPCPPPTRRAWWYWAAAGAP